MKATVLVCILWFAGLLIVGGVCAVVLPGVHAGPRRRALGERVGTVVNASVTSLTRPVTAAVVMFTGMATTVILCWWLGKLAKWIEGPLDHPFFKWWANPSRRVGGHWDRTWRTLTNIGGLNQTQGLAVVAAVFFAVVWWRMRRKWWVPPVIMLVGYLMEKYGQTILKLVVHRGHPPTTLGTYPSGGCARVLTVFGLTIFLILKWWQPQNRRWWYAGWTVLALCLGIEAYARIYNQEHWVTDVFGGIAFGTMVLLVMIATYLVLEPPRHPAEADGDPNQGRRRATVGARS